MAFSKLLLKPGLNTTATPLLNEAGWSFGRLIRFFQGILSKLGGWQRLSTDTFVGYTRGLLAWADLTGVPYVAGGSSQRLEVLYVGQLYDITPVDRSDDVTTPFDTTASSVVLTVNDNAHGATEGDTVHIVTPASVGGIIVQGFYVIDNVVSANEYEVTLVSPALSTETGGGETAEFTTTNTVSVVEVLLVNHGFQVGDIYTVYVSTVVGGLTLFGQYVVDTVVDADNFTFNAGDPASSDDTGSENGGDVRFDYLLAPGLESAATAGGYSEGGYGLGPYSYGGLIGAPTPLRQWSLGAWGQFLIASPTNLGIYVWDPTGGIINNPATIISQAPDYNTGFFIAMPERQIVAFGAQDPGTGDQDPLLVRWCDVDDYTVWTASSINQAGSYRLPRGSRIVGGIQGPQFGLLWTDLAVWAMQYIQPPLVYGFNEIAAGCGLIAMRAVGILGTDVYWMSQKEFFVYSGGGVQQLPCAVWDEIFPKLDTFQADKITAAPNSSFDEIAWFFPSLAGGGEVDSYVKFNKNGAWDYGPLCRTSWVDQSLFGPPMGTDENKRLQQHEVSNDADGEVLYSSATTAWFKMSDGSLYIYLDRLLPDFQYSSGAQIQLTVEVTDYPWETPTTYGPYTVTSSTKYVIVRARGRLARITVASNDLGSFWRLGEILYLSAPSGGR